MVAGMAVALMFAAIESWLSFSISKHVRGEVMSVYMVLRKRVGAGRFSHSATAQPRRNG